MSVVVCTFNRKKDIVECVESILNQDYPDFDVWVIDDASTDGTMEALRDAFSGEKRLHLIRNEVELGNTLSRNIAMRTSKGEIIASTDDDCIVAEDWLSNLVKVFDEGDDIGLVCGRVLPIFYTPVPEWLKPPIYPILAIRTEKERTEHLSPYGCNMAVRRDVMEKVNYLNEDITRKHGTLYSGEDTDLGLRVRAAGYRVVYTPDAVVKHKMFPYRLTREHFIERALYFGMSEVMFSGKNTWGILDAAANITAYFIRYIIRPRFYNLTLIAYKFGWLLKALGGGEEEATKAKEWFMRFAQKAKK
ncbi:MAG: glycosyltransferase family 2 protein [Candidatus Freyarchaeota archaeon]|nr:glycosyltransferase family 2 protein [Candidatus Freyrarchaeum guaymaensis]